MAFALSHYIHYLLLLWLLPPSTLAQTNANNSLGSYLTALDDNSSWNSPSGEFAFGFRPIFAINFLLSIWFDKIPEKTIIWSANGNSLVQRGSKVELTTGGQLVLSDTNMLQVWAADVAASGVNYVSMLNTGNFVFNSPTDTILPAQKWNSTDLISKNPVSTTDFFQRGTLDYDGVFRQYIYPKANGTSAGGWLLAWSITTNIPSDIYQAFSLYGDHQEPICNCLPGYAYLDSDNKVKGCKQNFALQTCDEGLEQSDQHFYITVTELINMDFSEDACRNSFLNGNAGRKNNFSQMALSTPASEGKVLSNWGTIQLSLNNFSINELHATASNCYGHFTIDAKKVKKMLQTGSVMPQTCPSTPGMNLRNFTYKELEEATFGFKEYWAVMMKISLQVKRLDKIVREGEQEFKTEVNAIGRTNHKHLVNLLGFCNEGQHQLLVYDFTSNSSLSSFLFGSSRPSWYQRVQITCNTQIIHCDIKPKNILWGGSYTERISDFGLDKLLKMRTKGYIAPESFRNRPITPKVDIYSFGVLLLEIICCRKNVKPSVEDKNQIILVDWAYDKYKEGRTDLLVENDEEAMNDMKRVKKFVTTSIWRIQQDPLLRPSTKNVLQMLEDATEVLVPTRPFPTTSV
ncbi:hypothetical protein ACB092_08G172100 [Castanea dentata]